jgi:hypothetical protein
MGNNVSLIILHNTATRGRVVYPLHETQTVIPGLLHMLAYRRREKGSKRGGGSPTREKRAFLGYERLNFNVVNIILQLTRHLHHFQPKRPIL